MAFLIIGLVVIVVLAAMAAVSYYFVVGALMVAGFFVFLLMAGAHGLNESLGAGSGVAILLAAFISGLAIVAHRQEAKQREEERRLREEQARREQEERERLARIAAQEEAERLARHEERVLQRVAQNKAWRDRSVADWRRVLFPKSE